MILLLNNLTLSLDSKMNLLSENATTTAGSDYYINFNKPWLGDKLTVESLFPHWILKEYSDNSNTVTIVPFIKNYLRWLLSQEYGYGAQLNWETLRVPLLTNNIFLEALADFYFPGADFSTSEFQNIIQNLRTFLVKADTNYFNSKGTPSAIKYAICSLFAIPWDSVFIDTGAYTTIEIKISTSEESNLTPYKSFIEKYIVPAGMSINYSTF
jgi:hypothetical protein